MRRRDARSRPQRGPPWLATSQARPRLVYHTQHAPIKRLLRCVYIADELNRVHMTPDTIRVLAALIKLMRTVQGHGMANGK
jgi:hypothetical protein